MPVEMMLAVMQWSGTIESYLSTSYSTSMAFLNGCQHLLRMELSILILILVSASLNVIHNNACLLWIAYSIANWKVKSYCKLAKASLPLTNWAHEKAVSLLAELHYALHLDNEKR